MKQTFSVILALFFLLLTAAYAGDFENKKTRDNFYSSIQQTFGFSKAECKTIRAAGYGAHFSLVMLYIAKEAGVPVSGLIAMRDNDGACWQEMCEKYGLDYEKIMARLRDEIIRTELRFPPEIDAEMHKNIATAPHKKGGK
jgi:hypothetical protein